MEFRNPKFINAQNTQIDCEINHPNFGWIPFTCDPNDTGALIDVKSLFAQMIAAGVKPYVAYQPTQQDKEAAIRAERDSYLQQSDWTQLPDVPQEIKDKWAIYRQALRDITKQPTFPDSVVWPAKPE